MKVISGTLKGRKIQGFDLDGTRPTMDRVKESLFAMIQEEVRDSLCLDLFAGSGNLGIEAISMGASSGVFVDSNPKAIQVITSNLKQFQILSQGQVFCMNYQRALEMFEKEQKSFDLIFLDPPYKENYITLIMRKLDQGNLLKEDGLVICELDRLELLEVYETLFLLKKKKYGDKWVVIYRKKIA